MHEVRRPILLAGEQDGRDFEFKIADAVLSRLRPKLASPFKQGVKRAFDIVVALLLVVVFAPLCLVVSLLVKRDGGPILFAHERVGRGGRIFKCLKFRTMVPDADKRLDEVLAGDPEAREQWACMRKLKHDPRVTRIGAYLRATSIDELPQLINVVIGDMSLVGPRPMVRGELSAYESGEHACYPLVRPGLTGLWQVSGRSHIPSEQRKHLDALYVRNWTLWGDVIILIRTIPAVIARHGAY